MRGIYSIDPSDEENQDIIKNARRKLETSKAAPLPCNRAFSEACLRETVVSKTERAKASGAKTRFSCITEAHESTRLATKRIHEGRIAGIGKNSCVYNLFAGQLKPQEGPKVTLREKKV